MSNNPSTRPLGQDSRAYIHPETGISLPSVTTILNKVAKPAMSRWAAIEVAKYAVENDDWRSLKPEDAVNLLKAAPWKKRDKASNIGTEAHVYAEHLLLEKPHSFSLPGGGNVAENIKRVLDYLKPKPVVLEGTVWNERVGYAGTFDGILEVDGLNCIIDWKSGKSVYPEYVLQLAAYRYGEYILRADGSRIDIPEIDRAYIFHVPVNGHATIYTVDASESAYHAFYAVKVLYDWLAEEAHIALVRKRYEIY